MPISWVLYGSDSPYSDTRGKIMDVPGPMGKAFITPEIFPWTLPHLREWYLKNKPNITFLVYHQLDAMNVAFNELGLSKSDISDIFSGNANRLIGRITNNS